MALYHGNTIQLKNMFCAKTILFSVVLSNGLLFLAALPAVDDPIVILPHGGQLKGSVTYSNFTSKEYFSFKGIPYAEPPVGPLRFKGTVPHKGWTGVRDATKHGDVCLQPSIFTLEKDVGIIGSEDCLFLNVFMPKNSRSTEALPIMVYVHGGAYLFGSGNDDNINPEIFLDEDVIVVQINYRLGFLGFFSTADRNSPGNYGLKDTLEALRWVQANIHAFGGDRDRVTLFGESAGGMTTSYLKLSPLSKGLFHRAISQSGTVLVGLGFQEFPRTYAFTIAREMNITFDTSEELVRQLMEIEDPRIFVQYTPEWIIDGEIPRGKQPCVFSPSVEPEDSDEPRVLPDTPLNLYLNGDFPDVPHILMVMGEEHLMAALDVEENPKLFELLEQHPEHLLPYTWKIQPNTVEAAEYNQQINRLYSNIKNVYDYVHFASDSFWNYGSYKAARLQVTRQKSNTYFATFSFDGDLTHYKHEGGLSAYIGASHADDLPYMFTNPDFPVVTEDNPAYKVRARMIKMWTDFAKYGDPTPTLNDLVNVKWTPVRDGVFHFMNITEDLVMQVNPFGSRMSEWWEMDQKFN